jgi:lipopolysaccharide export LptBFGC system permease protein LptF
MLSAVKLVLVFNFFYITWSTIRTALGSRMGLSPFFTVLQIPVLAAILGYYIMQARREA